MKLIKLFFINLALLIGGTMLVYLLSITLFATIFNAIMGNPVSGAYATNVFMRICLPVINGLAICIPHARNAEARRDFLNAIGAEKYDRKADFKALVKTKDFRNECIVFSILYIVMFLSQCRQSGSSLLQFSFSPLSTCGTIPQCANNGQASASVWQTKNNTKSTAESIKQTLSAVFGYKNGRFVNRPYGVF